MRLGEECPYITPCGWCSRQGKPCEKRQRKRVGLPAIDLKPATEALKKMASALNLPEPEEDEETEDRDMAADHKGEIDPRISQDAAATEAFFKAQREQMQSGRLVT